MKKVFVLILFFALGKSSFAQLQQKVRISGDPMLIKSVKGIDLDIEGNPFLYDKWMNATIVFKDSTFKNMQAEIKYNVMSSEVLVKTENGSEGVFREPIKEFILKNDGKLKVFRDGFTGAGLKNEQFAEVLYDGKIKFLKLLQKDIIETKGYNTAVVSKKIDQNVKYFFVQNGKVTDVKLNDRSVLDYLNSNDASNYVKENKLNLKKENDIISLLRNIFK
ncbi:hypothetical protein [Pedobacter montanisoli]|uniref:Uncharacterized protein n=1 Tax=Pedobacter montanisoli TaxID=2923277 RepID=A0ABS9ZUY5_9SPHI|nr:hypothetical protein [Pedobacter montanisoli]MCJ0741834.1 hypothetical protein [Pedobacter montanisoli]